MKKIISMLLVLTMVLAMVGCGSKDKSTNNTTDNSSKNNVTVAPEASSDSEGTDGAKSDEIYNMVMEIINYGYDDKDIKMVEDAVNAITEPAIGVHVTFLTVPIANMSTKLELMVAGGEQMDLVQTGLLTTPNNLAASGLLTPLTDLLAKSEVLTSLAGDLLGACTVQGEIYAYPANLYPGVNVSFIYDSDLAAQYNIKMPERITSEADWEYIFDQVLASGMPQYGITTGDGVNVEWTLGADYDALGDSAYNSYGVVMGMETGTKVENWYATETYKKQCEMKRKWYEKGYVLPDSISNGYTVRDSMSQGTVFGYVTQIGTGTSVAYWSAQTGKTLASIPISDVSITASGVVNLSWGISSTCERPEKVIEFLELLYTDAELANLISYGIEGTHYITQEGSKIIKYPDGIDSMSVGYGSFIGPFGDSTQIYYREPLTDQFVTTIPNFGLGKAKVSQYMGYTFDTSKVQTELTAVNAVISQYAPSLACGIVDTEKTISEFLSALTTAGIDKVIAENQAQLDAFIAK